MNDQYFALIHSIALDEPNSGYTAEKIDLKPQDVAVVVEQEPDVICDALNTWDKRIEREIIQALKAGDTMELGRIFQRELTAQCKARIVPDLQDECTRLSELRAVERDRRAANAASIPAEGPL